MHPLRQHLMFDDIFYSVHLPAWQWIEIVKNKVPSWKVTRGRWSWERRDFDNFKLTNQKFRRVAYRSLRFVCSVFCCCVCFFLNMKVKCSVMNLFSCFRIIHLACTFIFHFTIMRDLEKMAGWLRLAIIYIFSGIGGYLYSAILLPYQAEVSYFCFLFFTKTVRLLCVSYKTSFYFLPFLWI